MPLSNTVVVDLPEKGHGKFTLEELQTGQLSEKSNAEVVVPFVGYVEEEGVEILSFDQSATAAKAPQPEGRSRSEKQGQRSEKQPDHASKGQWRRDAPKDRNQAKDKPNRAQRQSDEEHPEDKASNQENKNYYHRRRKS